MKTTIREISRLTGFSPATVSNALNKKPGVNKKTAGQIFQTARELGYFGEAVADERKIRLVIYKTNGSIADNTDLLTMILDGAQAECKKAGYELTVRYLDRRDEDFEQLVQKIIKDVHSPLIVIGAELLDEDFHFFEHVSSPFVIVNYWNSRVKGSGILIDNEDAVIRAVEYLAERGHRKIGHLKSKFGVSTFREREAGYRKGLDKNGIPFCQDYTVPLELTLEGAYRGMRRYLESRPKLPTAYFADNDSIALGVIKALKEAGLRVPGEISIIGFDDVAFAEISSPRLSSLRVPGRAMGSMAVRQVLDLVTEGEPVRTKILVCSELIERDSVSDIRMDGDPRPVRAV